MHYVQNSLGKVLFCGVLIFASNPVQAQLTLDNTLGTEASRVTPNVLINGVISDRIDGGAIRGSNLFQSFSEFNISDGQRVYFANPSGVINILMRVTGGNASNIFGTLGVDGNANLFLMNPNGILFGENARLDLRGSFVGTTANGVQFGEQGLFSATNPEAVPLLTVNPSALFFNSQLDRGNITNLARLDGLNGETNFIGGPVGLQVGNGKTLALVGGNILLDNGNLTALGGKIEVASVMEGSVKLTQTETGFNFNYDAINSFGEIKLENTAVIDAMSNDKLLPIYATTGGNVVLTGQDITIDDSLVLNGIKGNSGSTNTQAGDIQINAKGTVNIDNDSRIFNYLDSEAIGNLGNLKINTRRLNINNGTQVGILNLGEGNTGDLIVTVAEEIQLNGGEEGKFGGLFTQLVGKGTAANILIDTGVLNILNGAAIGGGIFGEGNVGKIEINARETVSLSGNSRSRIQNDVGPGAQGDTGGISINTGSLFLSDKAVITSNVSGRGNSGGVNIVARDLVSLDDAGEITRGGQPGTLILSRVNQVLYGHQIPKLLQVPLVKVIPGM